MTAVRVHRIGGSTPAALTIRVHRIAGSGATTKLRIHRIAGTGISSSTVTVNGADFEPGFRVILTAVRSGSAPTNETWRVAATTNGARTPNLTTYNGQAQFTAPPTKLGTTLTIEYVPFDNGVAGAAVLVNVNVMYSTVFAGGKPGYILAGAR